MEGGKFNTIVILDAIPEGELNTALLLNEELSDISNSTEGMFVRYSRVETFQAVADQINKLTEEVQGGGVLPSLHIEAHGFDDESGFVTARNEPCSWESFKDLITPLNIATELNLMVVMAACYGGSFARAIRVTDRAPVWGVLGPTREITAGQLNKSFCAFYSSIFKDNPEMPPFTALNASVTKGAYYLTTAQEFFNQVWVNYKEKLCTEDELAKRALDIKEKYEQQGVSCQELEAIKQNILDKDPELFDKFRDFYFMYDLYEMNRELYPVTYNEALARTLKNS